MPSKLSFQIRLLGNILQKLLVEIWLERGERLVTVHTIEDRQWFSLDFRSNTYLEVPEANTTAVATLVFSSRTVMVQEFHVVRCFSCRSYQVDQVWAGIGHTLVKQLWGSLFLANTQIDSVTYQTLRYLKIHLAHEYIGKTTKVLYFKLSIVYMKKLWQIHTNRKICQISCYMEAR